MPGNIYTRRGDDGTTQLFFSGPERIAKDDLRVEAYGCADEAGAAIGLARAYASEDGQPDVAALLLRLWRELFVLNAELATAPANWGRLKDGFTLVTQQMVDALESLIDDLSTKFEQPKDFIAPGNSRLGAALDLARTVVRRTERAAVRVAHADDVRPEALRFLNRLADLLWVLERYAERDSVQPGSREGGSA